MSNTDEDLKSMQYRWRSKIYAGYIISRIKFSGLNIYMTNSLNIFDNRIGRPNIFKVLTSLTLNFFDETGGIDPLMIMI